MFYFCILTHTHFSYSVARCKGSSKLLHVDFTVSVLVNLWPEIVNGGVDIGYVRGGNVGLDALLGLWLGDLVVSISVACVHPLGGIFWLNNLGELVGFHGGSELLSVDFAVSVLVNVLETLVNHLVGLSVVLWVGDVGVDASVGLIDVDSTGSISVASINDVLSRWSFQGKSGLSFLSFSSFLSLLLGKGLIVGA